jgi:hypothetical protein
MDIVRRAYELWEQAGKPDGRDQELYHQAERKKQTSKPSQNSRINTASELSVRLWNWCVSHF